MIYIYCIPLICIGGWTRPPTNARIGGWSRPFTNGLDHWRMVNIGEWTGTYTQFSIGKEGGQSFLSTGVEIHLLFRALETQSRLNHSYLKLFRSLHASRINQCQISARIHCDLKTGVIVGTVVRSAHSRSKRVAYS
jgi:hypothetical protein